MRGSEIRTVLHNQINNCRNNIKAAPSYCFNAQRLYVLLRGDANLGCWLVESSSSVLLRS
jgi:hypothetical protein